MVSNMRTRLGGGSRSTRNEVLAEAYFRWLIHKVRTDGRSRYHDLLWIMDNTEFVWIVPNDDNRLMDGLELRKEFFREQKIRGKPLARPCSILEVVVGLSRRLEWLQNQVPLKSGPGFYYDILSCTSSEIRYLPERKLK